MSGTLNPQTLNGTVEVRGVKYKFSADIELKAEVIMHLRLKGVNEAPVWGKTVAKVVAKPEITPVGLSKTPLSTREIIAAVIVSLVASALPALRMTAIRPGATTSIMYFNHSIDPKLHESPDA
jgi:hypothetical protein